MVLPSLIKKCNTKFFTQMFPRSALYGSSNYKYYIVLNFFKFLGVSC